MRLLAFLAATLLPLAGCLGSEEPPAQVETATTAPGDVPADASNATGAAKGTEAPLSPPVVHPILFEGSLALAFGVCNPTGRSHCVEPLGDGGAEQVHEFAGEVVGGALNLTWTASGELTQELLLNVVSCGEESCAALGTATGASPLALTLTAAPEGHTGGFVYVTMPHPLEPASSASWVNVPQEFVVDGHLLFGSID